MKSFENEAGEFTARVGCDKKKCVSSIRPRDNKSVNKYTEERSVYEIRRKVRCLYIVQPGAHLG